MKLQELKIELHQYGEFQGQYTAQVEYEGKRGKVCLTLDPKVSHALLTFIGPTISKFSGEASKQLESAIEQSLLEAKTPLALEV